MAIFELIIALLIIGAALSAVAKKISVPYPALIALAGAALALIPGVPTLALDPELVLALFIAPVLLDAAYDASPRDLQANWKPVASLALGAVALTVAVVAVVAKHFVPDLPWAAAVALGAIVAPPDAVAASTVLKPLKPPHRLLVILEGESLFNDASALLIFRLAVAASVNGFVSGWNVIQTLLIVSLGSVVLGLILARMSTWIMSHVEDVSIAVILQFCTTFAVWICAERLHLSGIITVVVFAISAARWAPEFMEAKMRIPAWSVWEVAVFILNILAFLLIGLQLKSIVARTNGTQDALYLTVTLAVFLTVILVRLAWVSAATAVRRWRALSRDQNGASPFDISIAGSVVAGWSGMRGTVTVAAALALPLEFPYRDLILAAAFGVTLGTLVLQGMTLRPLMAWLGIKEDSSVDEEASLARKAALRSALEVLERSPDSATASLIKQSYELQLSREQEAAPTDNSHFSATEISVVKKAFDAQRDCLTKLRSAKTIGDSAYQKVEEELDWMELGWMQLLKDEDKG